MDVLRLTVAFALVGSVLYTIEALTPAIRTKPFWREDGWLDVGYWFFTGTVTKLVSRAAMYAAVGVVVVLMGRKLSPEIVNGFPPVSNQPVWLIVFEVLLLGDLISYWMHRAFHRGRLWGFHAIHHSSTQLDWLSSARLHPINDLVMKVAQVAPFVLLGFPLTVLASYLPFITFYALLVHANINWSFGPLRWVMVTPLFHRWHHTAEEDGLDKNFAGLFPLWDIIFGTIYLPEGKAPTQFGVRGEQVPATLLGQLSYPFRRAGANRAEETRGPSRQSG